MVFLLHDRYSARLSWGFAMAALGCRLLFGLASARRLAELV
jgi:hypothetical protein